MNFGVLWWEMPDQMEGGLIDWWWWINRWMDKGWGTNRWWMESKTDIRVPVVVLVRSQSNAIPQALVLLGPSVVQVWDSAQTARRVWSWKEARLPRWRLYLFCDSAESLVSAVISPVSEKTLTVLAYMDPSPILGIWILFLQTCAASAPKCAAF